MTPAAFTAWVDHMKVSRGWSDQDCRRALGCGFNQVRRWKQTGAPLYIALACAALSYGLPAFTLEPPQTQE